MFAKDYGNGQEINAGTYMDEFFGGASNMESFEKYKAFMDGKYNCTWRIGDNAWDAMLGFDAAFGKGEVSFGTKKYVRELVNRFLKGESKPTRKSASRESIMKLQLEAAQLPEAERADERRGRSARPGRACT